MQLDGGSIAALVGIVVAGTAALTETVRYFIRRSNESAPSRPTTEHVLAQRELELARHTQLIESITRLVTELHELTGKASRLTDLVSRAHVKLENQTARIDRLLSEWEAMRKEIAVSRDELHAVARHIATIKVSCPNA